MNLDTWMLFCATETVLCLTPGPAVLLVVSQGLTRGFRAGSDVSLGILLANGLYFAISATGIAALLLASGELFFAIKWLGAAYLIWLGLRSMLGARRHSGRDRPSAAALQEAAEPSPAPASSSSSRLRGVGHGFVTQAANPKTLLFFSALLPQFIDVAAPIAGQILILGASSIAIELAVLLAYAALANRGRMLAAPSLASALQRIGGALLIAAGAGLATLRRANS